MLISVFLKHCKADLRKKTIIIFPEQRNEFIYYLLSTAVPSFVLYAKYLQTLPGVWKIDTSK